MSDVGMSRTSNTLASRVLESCGYSRCRKWTHVLIRDLWSEVTRLQAQLDARAADLGRVTQDTSHAIKQLEVKIHAAHVVARRLLDGADPVLTDGYAWWDRDDAVPMPEEERLCLLAIQRLW